MSFDQQMLDAIGLRMSQSTPQAAALNFRLVSAGPEGASMAVPWREDLVGDPSTGVLAGGVVTTLLDHVCGLAVSCAVIAQGGAISDYGMATLDLRIDYMRAARPRRDVIGKAVCYKITRSIAFLRGVAFDEDESDPVATAQAAFAFTGPRPPMDAAAQARLEAAAREVGR